MLRSVALGAATLASAHAQTADVADSSYYWEEHALSRVSGVLDDFLKKPVDLLRWSQLEAAQEMRSVAETEAFRQLCFTQVLSQAAERGDSSVSMIYGAFADGRFIGYRLSDVCTASSCEPTFVFRAAGDAPAAGASWSPWTLDTVNQHCALSPSCSHVGQPVRAGDTSVRTVSARVRLSASVCASAHLGVTGGRTTRRRWQAMVSRAS
jgi:hypothetical protein